MDLERKIEALRTGRPIAEAEKKDEMAKRMMAEVSQLEKEAEGELKDAERRRQEADKMARAAAEKVCGSFCIALFLF